MLLISELVAVLLAAASFRHTSSPHPVLVRTGLLLAMAIAYGEVCDRLERLRRYLGTDGVVSNHNSVLCFAGLLALPLHLAAALTIAVYLHTFLRSRRHHSARPHRLIFTAAAAVLATFVAGDLYRALGGALTDASLKLSLLVLATLVVYISSNLAVLVVGMYAAARPKPWQVVLPDRHQVEYEGSTLLLGIFTGILALASPWLAPGILILVAILQRSSLVADLQQAASRDGKTDLLNSRAWQALAETYLFQARTAQTSVALLLVDVDHFKAVNDSLGHLAGDAALRTVADILTHELRGYDAVGRYGGEEFVVLLPEADGQLAMTVAERLRSSISSITAATPAPVTVSIGVAACMPGERCRIDHLIETADEALYTAKRSGRDRVQMGADVDHAVERGMKARPQTAVAPVAGIRFLGRPRRDPPGAPDAGSS